MHPQPVQTVNVRHVITRPAAASRPRLSIRRRKKEMRKEGSVVAKELKRLHCHPVRFKRFMKSHVSRLLKYDPVALRIHEDDMRCSPDPPLCLPYRVILKGLIPYPELREKVKDDFLELFTDMIVYDPQEDLFDDDDDRRWRTESEED